MEKGEGSVSHLSPEGHPQYQCSNDQNGEFIFYDLRLIYSFFHHKQCIIIIIIIFYFFLSGSLQLVRLLALVAVFPLAWPGPRMFLVGRMCLERGSAVFPIQTDRSEIVRP